jgi:hypothetical protein
VQGENALALRLPPALERQVVALVREAAEANLKVQETFRPTYGGVAWPPTS